MSDPTFQRDGLWGFWNETWSDASYGYSTKREADLACLGYCELELEGCQPPYSEAARFWIQNNQPFRTFQYDMNSDPGPKIMPTDLHMYYIGDSDYVVASSQDAAWALWEEY